MFMCACSFYLFPEIQCRGNPIGMENGTIPDESITASSWQDPFKPEAGRLGNKDGAWCANTSEKGHKKSFLQIEFPSTYSVCAFAAQGSPVDSSSWVTKYRIQYSVDGQNFKAVVNTISGNTDASDLLKHNLYKPITARFIRFVPREWNNKPCMRVEVYGNAIGKKSTHPLLP
ncbi:hypothetical protein ACROYT_G021423 [Oculina patagonica]